MKEQRRLYNIVLTYSSPDGPGQHLASVEAPTLDLAFVEAKKSLLTVRPSMTGCSISMFTNVDISVDIPEVKEEPVSVLDLKLKPDYKALTMILREEYAKTPAEKRALKAILDRFK